MDYKEYHSFYFESVGRFKILKQLFRSSAELCQFVEADLEDSPMASSYMAQLEQNLQLAETVVKAFENNSREEWQYEGRSDLRQLLDEVAERTQMISSAQINYNCDRDKEYLVQSFSEELLDAMMTLICTVVGLEGTISIDLKSVSLVEGHPLFRRAELPEGEYWQVDIVPGNFDANDWKPLSQERSYLEAFLKSNDLIRAYGTVVLHQGELFVASSDVDCSLSILLPAEALEAQDVIPDLDDLGSEAVSQTILLVDDEDMIWDVVIDSLQDLGYMVLLAEDGVDAVEIYRENPGLIDVVVLDMVMPRMNGREAFYELKKLDDNVRVILSSGYMAEGDAGDIINDGAKGFLRKPYRVSELSKLIQQAAQ